MAGNGTVLTQGPRKRPISERDMFYTEHVRIGNQVRIGYFMHPFKRPFWIGRKVKWYMTTK